MSNVVIGPIAKQDWLDMRLLNSSVKWMKQTDLVRYSPCIKKEINLYNEYLDKYSLPERKVA
jgi:hypothetical protein